ncbi:taurine dioxygenase [Croceicoccus estronivorus]|nr:taurine dioxygenase [Croceicoccus estronivorus]
MTTALKDLTEIRSPAGWTGDEITHSTDWLYQLSNAEVMELETVGTKFLMDDPDLRTVTADRYPLPVTASALVAWMHDMDRGRGFVLVRGLRSELYSDALSAAIFFLLGLHLGRPMAQNQFGDLFDHVVATSDKTMDDPSALPSRTRDRLNFHSDSSDVVGLMCLRGAREGGASILISGVTIYNEVVRRRPDLAPLLYETWHYDWYRQDHDAPARYYSSPMVSFVDGVFSMYAGSNMIRSAQDYPEVPRMTPQQYELLDLLDEIFLEPGLPVTMDFRPGDIQWLLNYAALHSRSGYRDFEQPERKRHLLRLWLKRDVHRPLTPGFGKPFVARKVGLTVSDEDLRNRISQVCYPRREWGL